MSHLILMILALFVSGLCEYEAKELIKIQTCNGTLDQVLEGLYNLRYVGLPPPFTFKKSDGKTLDNIEISVKIKRSQHCAIPLEILFGYMKKTLNFTLINTSIFKVYLDCPTNMTVSFTNTYAMKFPNLLSYLEITNCQMS